MSRSELTMRLKGMTSGQEYEYIDALCKERGLLGSHCWDYLGREIRKAVEAQRPLVLERHPCLDEEFVTTTLQEICVFFLDKCLVLWTVELDPKHSTTFFVCNLGVVERLCKGTFPSGKIVLDNSGPLIEETK